MSSNTIDYENVIIIAIELSRSIWLVAARLPGSGEAAVSQDRRWRHGRSPVASLIIAKPVSWPGQALRRHFRAASRRGVRAVELPHLILLPSASPRMLPARHHARLPTSPMSRCTACCRHALTRLCNV